MKVEENNIFDGMPSMCGKKRLEFSQKWPTNFNLPSPFIVKSTKTSIPQREVKLVTQCPHQNKKHYAKNMCKNCYIKIGRIKPAWMCQHKDKAHYAKGQCQLCYLSGYNKIKKEKYQL